MFDSIRVRLFLISSITSHDWGKPVEMHFPTPSGESRVAKLAKLSSNLAKRDIQNMAMRFFFGKVWAKFSNFGKLGFFIAISDLKVQNRIREQNILELGLNWWYLRIFFIDHGVLKYGYSNVFCFYIAKLPDKVCGKHCRTGIFWLN